MKRSLPAKRLTTVSIALSAILGLYSGARLMAFQALTDPAFVESVRQSRREIAAFDAAGKSGEANDPRRKWADYFWQYYEDHLDLAEGSHAAARAAAAGRVKGLSASHRKEP